MVWCLIKYLDEESRIIFDMMIIRNLEAAPDMKIWWYEDVMRWWIVITRWPQLTFCLKTLLKFNFLKMRLDSPDGGCWERERQRFSDLFWPCNLICNGANIWRCKELRVGDITFQMWTNLLMERHSRSSFSSPCPGCHALTNKTFNPPTTGG